MSHVDNLITRKTHQFIDQKHRANIKSRTFVTHLEVFEASTEFLPLTKDLFKVITLARGHSVRQMAYKTSGRAKTFWGGFYSSREFLNPFKNGHKTLKITFFSDQMVHFTQLSKQSSLKRGGLQVNLRAKLEQFEIFPIQFSFSIVKG